MYFSQGMDFRECDSISVWFYPFSILVTVKQHITQTKQQLAATNGGVAPLCIAKSLFWYTVTGRDSLFFLF